MEFILSKYGGDKFKIYAKADVDDSGKPGGDVKETKQYMTWRKFWYQQSYYSELGPLPDLADAEKAYKNVGAYMCKSQGKNDIVRYDRQALKNKGVEKNTLYKKNHVAESVKALQYDMYLSGATSDTVLILPGGECAGPVRGERVHADWL